MGQPCGFMERWSKVPTKAGRASERERLGGGPVPKCGANRGPHKGPCGNMAGAGTDHPGIGRCKIHRGNTASHRKAAARQMARNLADQIKASLTEARATDDFQMTPEQALIEELKRTSMFVRWLEDLIGQWNTEEVDFETSGTESGAIEHSGAFPLLTLYGTGLGTRVGPTDRAEWFRVYQTERGHLARVAKMCIDANIEERYVRLAEQEGAVLAAVVRTILARLELTEAQLALVPTVVPQVFVLASRGELPGLPVPGELVREDG